MNRIFLRVPRIVFLALFVCLVLPAGAVYAFDFKSFRTGKPTGEVVGKVMEYSPNVTVVRNRAKESLRVGAPVYSTDSFEADVTGSAKIQMNDGSVLEIYSSTKVKMSDFIRMSSGSSGTGMFSAPRREAGAQSQGNRAVPAGIRGLD